MTDKSKFVLKLSGIDLENIKAGDIGRLLKDFCNLLGDEYLHFDGIYSGSAILKVCTAPEHYSGKLEKLNLNITKQIPALEDINKVLRTYSKTFTDIEASILASRTAVNDDDMELIHQINYHKPNSHTFTQVETFIGELWSPEHRKGETDRFVITLANDEDISVSVSKSLSLELAPHLPSLWKSQSLIKFTGTACYELQQKYNIVLKSFNANGFEIIDNRTTARSWMKDFIECGESGWQNDDDPISTWLEERHS